MKKRINVIIGVILFYVPALTMAYLTDEKIIKEDGCVEHVGFVLSLLSAMGGLILIIIGASKIIKLDNK